MARGINKIILVGNLGQDPETTNLPSGGSVTNFSLATSSSWKDKLTGEPKERTEWHRVVAYGKQGETIAEYAKKGSKLYVEGEMRYRKWQDQGGNSRSTPEVALKEFQFLDSRGSSAGSSPSPSPSAAPPADDFDDDIPF